MLPIIYVTIRLHRMDQKDPSEIKNLISFVGRWTVMEQFSLLLALCEGNPSVTGGFPLTKASDAELWCFFWLAPEQTAMQTGETPVIWDAIGFIMTSL